MNNSFFDFELFAVPERDAGLSKCQGKYRSRIFILYRIETDGSSEKEYLSAILQPLQLDLDRDTHFLPVSPKETISLAGIVQQYNPKHLLLFGIHPPACGLRIQLMDYQPLKFQSRYFLKADSLFQIRTERENNDNRKAGALWKALKTLFSDS